MTFTTSLKEEISKREFNAIEARFLIEAYLLSVAKFLDNEILITLENASIARRIYKEIKRTYQVNPKIIIRIQKRFKVKQIYIISIKEKVNFIKEDTNINYLDLVSEEERTAFLTGVFLATGNVTNPSTSGYHLEFILSSEILAKKVLDNLKFFNLKAKLITRKEKYVAYIKSSECISDLIKLFQATSSLFYFEDIRIYKDHKNMINRLNNCDIANLEKTFKAGQNQIKDINYLKDNDLFDLLDSKSQLVASARLKNPESSLAELANIISKGTEYKIGKSGVNHHFRKINELVKRHQERGRNNESKTCK